MLAEKIGVLVLVAGGDEFLESQRVVLVGEVVEELADLGIIAVAQDGLALEVLGVVLELLLDVGKLGVELVLLGRLGGMQASVQRLDPRIQQRRGLTGGRTLSGTRLTFGDHWGEG